MNSQSKSINELMAEAADKALELFEAGMTKAQIIEHMTSNGTKIGNAARTAIDVAELYYTDKTS